MSDRLLEFCGALNKKLQKSEAQFLDTLKVERERGITVKAQTASMIYKHENEDYLYNLIDTPVDINLFRVMLIFHMRLREVSDHVKGQYCL